VRNGLIVGGIVGAVIGAFVSPTDEYSRGFNVVALGGVVGGLGAAGGVMFGAAAPREPVVIYRDTRHLSASIGAMRAARAAGR
jgi:hypothetical protein